MKTLAKLVLVLSLFCFISCESDDKTDLSSSDTEVNETGDTNDNEEIDDGGNQPTDEVKDPVDPIDPVDPVDPVDPDDTDSDDDNTIIEDTWNISNVEIVNSLLSNTVQQGIVDVDVTVSFSSKMTGDNDYTSIFTEDPNTLVNNGSFDLEITTIISYTVFGNTTEEPTSQINTFNGTGETSEWSIDGDNIDLTLPSSTDVVQGKLIELNENSLIISTSLIDFIDNFEVENQEALDDFTGEYGDVIFTYTKS